MALSLKRSMVFQVVVIACAVLALSGPASAVSVTFEAGGHLFIPLTLGEVKLTGQGLLPLGRGSDPNSPSFELVQSKVTIQKSTGTIPIPELGRILSLDANDPVVNPSQPFTANIQTGHPLSFEDLIFFNGVAIIEDIDPNKNFAPTIPGGVLTLPLVGGFFARGTCAANTALPNLGCEGPAEFDWGLFPTIGTAFALPDIDGNGSPNQLRFGDANSPFFFMDGTVTFTGSPATVSYELDPNSSMPGVVNPPFTIGSFSGPITTTQDIVVPAGTDETTSVPEPALLTALGLSAGGLGLLLRFRALRARLKGGRP